MFLNLLFLKIRIYCRNFIGKIENQCDAIPSLLPLCAYRFL